MDSKSEKLKQIPGLSCLVDVAPFNNMRKPGEEAE